MLSVNFTQNVLDHESSASSHSGGVCTDMDVCSVTIFVIYIFNWFGLMFPHVLPLARPTVSMAGVTLGIFIRYLFIPSDDPENESALEMIELPVITILFAVLLVVYFVEKTGFFEWIKSILVARSGWLILLKLSALSAIFSAVFRNDSIAIIFTPLVIHVCQKLSLDYFPYLIALSTSSNIGSALAPSGNFQNTLLQRSYGVQDIRFDYWVGKMVVPVLFGWTINIILLLIFYRKTFFLNSIDTSVIKAEHKMHGMQEAETFEDNAGLSIYQGGPSNSSKAGEWRIDSILTTSHGHGLNKKDKAFSILVVVSMALFLVSFVIIDVSQHGFALILSMLLMLYLGIKEGRSDTNREQRDDKTEEIFEHQLDLPLILFFLSQQILVKILTKTNILEAMIKTILGSCLAGDHLLDAGCSQFFGIVILLMSNVLWNVPLVSVLIPILENLIEEHPGSKLGVYLITAWASTIAGNFTMIGSAVNLIVAASASRKNVYDEEASNGIHVFTTVKHALFGIPSTLIILPLGILYIRSIS